ncbi:MAG: proline dehydrogenase [Claussenomyces sp. TS43310]|nr:MAG: proline dehydrogenase [Claussenomyces sp. TS43310]
MARPFKNPLRVVETARPFFSHPRSLTTDMSTSTSTFDRSGRAQDGQSFSSSPSTVLPKVTKPIPGMAPLSIIPLSSLLRSIVINSISSSRILLPPSLIIMSVLAHSNSRLLNPDQNPLLRFFLKKTFYAQFCAGENPHEVQHKIKSLKDMGFKGVMLGYAKEVVLDEKASKALESGKDNAAAEYCIQNEILPWRDGTLQTVSMAEPGDFVSIKFTGAGSQALFDLSRQNEPSLALNDAITTICDLAASRGVRLLFDAEQQSLQAGIDAWVMSYMRRYNDRIPGKAVIYNTYQCYLKSAPKMLAQHLSIARKDGLTFGAKLVRGAYLGSDPRHLINDTKAETDANYDSIAESLMRRQYGAALKPADGETEQPFPQVNVVLAGHNHTSVRKALAIRTSQAERGEERVDMVYAQLQGMADEVSCELLQAAAVEKSEKNKIDVPQAYKYLVWGTTGECMKYLLRRAQENKDAVQRTREGRDAMLKELLRRSTAMFGRSV